MSARTIVLKSYSDIRNEYTAAGTIKPGSLVARDANGDVVVQATAAGSAPAMFAIEDQLQGKTTRQDYVSGDQVQTWYVQPGEEVLALIDSLLDPAIGDLLEVGTGGELQAASTGDAMFEVLSAKIVDDASNHRVAVRRI